MVNINTNYDAAKYSKYEQFEKSQIDAFREVEQNPNSSIFNDPARSLFKATPDGYMDLPQDKKMDVYRSSMLELGEGNIAKYDVNQNGEMDYDEFKEMNKNINGEIDQPQNSIMNTLINVITSLFKAIGIKLPEGTFDSIKDPYNSEETQAKTKEGFEAADVDGNGTLSKEEIAATYAYMDYSDTIYNEDGSVKEGTDGTLDGRIDLFKSTADDPKAKSNIAMFSDFLFN